MFISKQDHLKFFLQVLWNMCVFIRHIKEVSSKIYLSYKYIQRFSNIMIPDVNDSIKTKWFSSYSLVTVIAYKINTECFNHIINK